ncbi:MAG: alanine--glyoxylate aminotransferase family protein [Methanomicrobiales archaeon]|nr:alanine--glyoxylate aminotransferase family protein [Methanomicrobiales archaeon]
MENEPLLMLPGPVPIPMTVRAAMTRQAINHRGNEFGRIYAECTRMLRPLFGTKNEIFVLSGSGTAAMEAAVANFGEGRAIASLVNGKFGERLYRIAKRYGNAREIGSEWGEPLDIAGLERSLEEGTEVVTLVHNETSAGIRNPAEEVGRLTSKYGALLIMDGITSIGGDLVEADRWHVDVAFVGSQKCLAAPAGLSAISVSPRAWKMLCEDRPYYLDLDAYRKSASKNPMETPYTPAVPLFLALHEALIVIEKEGLTQRIERHRRLARAVRAATEAWGLALYPKIDGLHEYSNTVTAIEIPERVKDKDLRGMVKKLGIEIAGGQDRLKERIFRIGHMGAVGAPEMLSTLSAVEFSLRRAGFGVKGNGVQAACEMLV